MKLANLCTAAILVVAFLAFTGATAPPDPELAEASWTTDMDLVTFHLVFHNPDPDTPSLPVSGSVFSQEFGVFLPDQGLIDEFDIPPIPPESFFDVFFEVPLSGLPPTAGEILPGNGPLAPGVHGVAQPLCPPDDHWDGNVDIFWGVPGALAQVLAHYGTLQVGPGVGNSYIHVVTNCAFPATWTITGLCAGFSATLVNEDLSPAPNPVPAGWTGHICVSAAASVPVGSTCCFKVNFNCGGIPGVIDLCVEVCDWTTPVEPVTWGRIKSLYD